MPSEQLLPRAMVEQLSEQELRQLLQRRPRNVVIAERFFAVAGPRVACLARWRAAPFLIL